MPNLVFLVIGLIVCAGGIVVAVFRKHLARVFEKVWAASITRPLVPTSPGFFGFAGFILVAGGIIIVVRAFL